MTENDKNLGSYAAWIKVFIFFISMILNHIKSSPGTGSDSLLEAYLDLELQFTFKFHPDLYHYYRQILDPNDKQLFKGSRKERPDH